MQKKKKKIVDLYVINELTLPFIGLGLQGHIKLTKSDNKDNYNIAKDFYFN